MAEVKKKALNSESVFGILWVKVRGSVLREKQSIYYNTWMHREQAFQKQIDSIISKNRQTAVTNLSRLGLEIDN